MKEGPLFICLITRSITKDSARTTTLYKGHCNFSQHILLQGPQPHNCLSNVLVSFPSRWQKNTYGKQLEGGQFYFGSLFQRFQFIVAWSHSFGPIHRGGSTWWQLMTVRKQREKKKPGSQYPIQGHNPPNS